MAIAKITTLHFKMALTSRVDEDCAPRACVQVFCELGQLTKSADFNSPARANASVKEYCRLKLTWRGGKLMVSYNDSCSPYPVLPKLI